MREYSSLTPSQNVVKNRGFQSTPLNQLLFLSKSIIKTAANSFSLPQLLDSFMLDTDGKTQDTRRGQYRLKVTQTNTLPHSHIIFQKQVTEGVPRMSDECAVRWQSLWYDSCFVLLGMIMRATIHHPFTAPSILFPS